jgi:hypothetical protein
MPDAIEQLLGSGLTVAHASLGLRGTAAQPGSAAQQTHHGDTVAVRALGNFAVRFLGIDAAERSLPLPGGTAFRPDEAKRLERLMRDAGATDVQVKEPEPGILPIVGVVIGVIVAGAIADLIRHWRRDHECRTLVDARGDEIKMAKNCDFHDGVVSKDSQKVEISDPPDSLDLNKVVEAALRQGADAVKSIADAAGAHTTSPAPA